MHGEDSIEGWLHKMLGQSEKTDSSGEIATTALRTSLLCKRGRLRRTKQQKGKGAQLGRAPVAPSLPVDQALLHGMKLQREKALTALTCWSNDDCWLLFRVSEVVSFVWMPEAFQASPWAVAPVYCSTRSSLISTWPKR